MPATTELIVQTQSLYACIYDEKSPANVPSLLHHMLEEIDEHLCANEVDRSLALFALNGRLIECAKKGDLLGWTLLFDGVFRVAIEVQPPLHEAAGNLGEIENLAALHLIADLVCPSGRLVISCLGRVGERQPFAVDVGPGVHRVCFTSDHAEEEKHFFLESVTDYPGGGGPDWKITIRRISVPQAGSDPGFVGLCTRK